jgi:hypothetical protein
MKGASYMDIYEYAESINYRSDYMDMNTGYIYCIQEYGRAIKFGLPQLLPGIRVIDSQGNVLGYARKEENDD